MEAVLELDKVNLVAMKFAKANNYRAAADVYAQALAEHPGNAALRANLCGMLNKCGHWDRVIELCGSLIAQYPHEHRFFNHLGTAYWCKHDFAKAMASFQVVAEMMPDFHMPKHNLGTLWLMHRQYEEGWWGHEYRHAAKGRGLRYKVENLWDGVTPAPHLTIWGEQGIGDEILQLNCAADLRAAFTGKITWECSSRLRDMFARSFSDIDFVSRLDNVVRRTDPVFGGVEERAEPACHLPAASLGRIFRPNDESFTAKNYLKPLVTEGRPVARKRIGISWHSEKAQYTEWKSSPLSAWAPLLGLDADFVCLQYGNREALKQFPQVSVNPSRNYTADLDWLAGQVANCDLVVTVSNTTAHIAGAIGVPAIVLLPNVAILPWCWGRWDKTPWYPSVKVMHMAPGENWEGLLDRATLEVGSIL